MITLSETVSLLARHRRLCNGLLAGVCAALMAYALYSQHILGLEPCPLCAIQRMAMLVTGLVFLLAFIHGPGQTGARVYALLVALTAGAGATVAARHVWLQNLPPEDVPACGPGLEYMLDVFPLSDALRMIFTGSGECAEVMWRFLGLTMPGWVLLSFAGLIVAALFVNLPSARSLTAD